ncbi:MAG TPA: ATP-dependent helicase, partial [Candidatus Synoicihabitans sp.]|nr:ATP-dependent helicase [Candidatus Synoicihabitans sp.]
MLRLFLPPNLAAAAPRDAIAVKVELDLATTPPAEFLPGLAALQRFGARPAPVLFLQLTRAQLRELVAALRGQPVFACVNAPTKPLLWVGPILRGVSEHLNDPPPPPDSTPRAAPAPARLAATRPGEYRKSSIENPTTPLVVDGSEHFLALTLPSRESSAYSAALELVKEHGFRLEPSNRKWWLRDRHKVLNFLAAHLAALREEFHAEFTPNFTRNTAGLAFAEVATAVAEERDGFSVTLGIRAGNTADSAVQAALASGRGYLEDGAKVYLLDRDQLAKV